VLDQISRVCKHSPFQTRGLEKSTGSAATWPAPWKTSVEVEEITEETQWWHCGLVCDSGAGVSTSERRRCGRWVSCDEESQAGESSQTEVMTLATVLRDSDHLSHRLIGCCLGCLLLLLCQGQSHFLLFLR